MVLIERGTCSVFYDHWAANRLDLELFWGPKAARAFIVQRPPDPDCWLDDVWSEGGCVLDFDRRHLLWYGGEDVLFNSSVNLVQADLMRHQWPGWRIDWALDGIFDLARKAGVPLERVMSGRSVRDQALAPATVTRPATGGVFVSADAAISYKRGPNSGCGAVQGGVSGLANPDLSPGDLSRLVDGFDAAAFVEGCAEDYDWTGCTWGAHVDMDDKALIVWHSEPHEGLTDRIRQTWAGWRTLFLGPDFRWHAARHPDFGWPDLGAEAKRARLGQLRWQVSREQVNPVLGVLKALHAEDPDSKIDVNPSTQEHRGGLPTELAKRLAVLDRLEAGLPPADAQ